MTPLQNFLGWLAGVTCLLSPALAQGNPSDPLPPILSLTITAPAEGSRFTRGAPIPIRATAVDPQGAVYRLEFYAGRVRIGVSEIFTLVAIPPGEPVYHEFVWRDAPRGRHELRVKATGSGEFPQWSAPVTITLDDATPQPLTFEAPLDGSVWRTPGQIPLEITAVDPDGEIRRVEFFANEQLLGVSQILTRDVEIPGRPRTHWFTWTNPPAGTHRLQATAVAVRGGNVSSETRTIRVLEGNNHVFAFQEPPDQAQFALGEPIPIRVLTIWSDGYIDHLEFLADGKKIGDSVINFIQQPAPGTPILHEFIWNGAPPGEHRLTAQTILADGVLLESSESRIIRVGSGDQELPIVTVQTGRPYALEGDRFNRGEFIIQRTGDLTEDLSIYVTLSGRATRGVDYQLVLEPCDDCLKPDEEITGDTVVVPAGQAQVVVGVLANFDLLLAMEPVLESVQLQVYTPPTTAMVGARPPYIAGVPDQATVSVVDRQNPNGAELIMVSPEANAFLPLGVPNLLQAIAVDPQGSIRRVEFVGNDRLLGVSEITTEEVDIPGRLRVHNFGWRLNDPADAGPYTLVARATTAARIHLESNPVHVTAGGIDPNLPVVSTTRGKTPAFERGDLKSRTGGFVLSRRGGTGPNAALTVFVAVSGTATLGLDYQWFSLTEDDPAGNLPFFGPFFPVTFPDGVADVAFDFTALADELVEGRETVTVQVIDPPILSLLPIPPSYLIGEPHSADVVIEDANLEMPSIVLTRPTEGAHFNVGDVISLEATAVHPDAGVEMIRFIADGRIIATVNYCCDVCDCAPAPKATPFTARYEWNSAPPGVHVLVAQTI
ncbi:MAG TPA: hypothetical protein DCE44_23895, partial [Verrucomicrobiales bacterium]|nr:hypothetical protein [Verrucomicrobiales bacterium]